MGGRDPVRELVLLLPPLLVPPPLQVSCREESWPGMEMDLAVDGGVLKQGSPESRNMPMVTLRMELSWRVFLVSYPSNRQQRTVEPEPANSARFKSVKPSWEGKRKHGRLQRVWVLQMHQRG